MGAALAVMGGAFGTPPDTMPSYNVVHAATWGVLLCDDDMRGTAAAVSFGRTGWLGGITTAAQHRRQGVARAATVAAMDWLEARGAETILLHATADGAPLYAGLGFEPDGEYVVHRVPAGWAGAGLEPLGDFGWVAELDAAATGEDRTAVLELGFPRGGGVSRQGAAVALAWGAGHAVAADPITGERLLGAADPGGRWIVPDGNPAALAACAARGWAEETRTLRMRRGPRVPWRPEMVWGAFNLFWG